MLIKSICCCDVDQVYMLLLTIALVAVMRPIVQSIDEFLLRLWTRNTHTVELTISSTGMDPE